VTSNNITSSVDTLDRWAEWILHRRFGGDREQRRLMLEYLSPVREAVLDHARLAPGETLLDVGTGDGLIAFGAIERVGDKGTVIFSDISQDLLDHSRTLAEQMGVLRRCSFVRAPAEDLTPIESESVDVVTTRSVLIFVEDKQRALDECYRVLRPGGRISLFEPINRYFGLSAPDHLLGTYWGYDVSPVVETARKVRNVFEQAQPPGSCTMLDFDERDLLVFAERAGFTEISLDLKVSIQALEKQSWSGFMSTAPNPLAPTFGEAIAGALDATEAARFEEHLRPLVETGKGTRRSAVAHMWAEKR
jgi:SAM-dependent methyltransferase